MNTSSGIVFSTSPTTSMDKVAIVLYTFEGFFVCFINLFMFLRLMSIRELRNQKEFVTMGACILFDAIFGLTYLAAGIWRAYIFFNFTLIPAFSQWSCFLSPSVQLFIIITPAAGYILVATALDRFICIFFPIRYIKLSVIYSYMIMFLPYFLDIPTHIASIFDSLNAPTALNKTMVCMMYFGISISLYGIMRMIRITCSFIAVLIYIPVAAKMYMIVKRHQQQVGISTKGQKKLLRLTGTIALITINTLILFTVPDIITLIDPTINTFLFYVMNLNKGVVNILALLATQQPLRRLFNKRAINQMLSTIQALTFELEAAISAKAEMELENERLLVENYQLRLQNEDLFNFVQQLTENANNNNVQEVPNRQINDFTADDA